MKEFQMKHFRLLSAVLILTAGQNIKAQKTISDGVIVYSIDMQSANPSIKAGTVPASKTVYLKGSSSRTEQITFLGNETNIHDAKSGNAVVLKEFSGQKLMITLTKDNWTAKNKGDAGVKFELSNEEKTVNGYNTKKAIAKKEDGKTFIVWYAPDLQVVNKDYDPTFANLPGLAMEYEIESGQLKFKYTVTKVNFDPVLLSRFDFPKSGYRVMTYEENQQMRKGASQ
jgi:GLPGLI family protein